MVVGWARWLDVGQCVVVKVLSVGEGVIYLPVVLQAVRMCDGLKSKGSGDGSIYVCALIAKGTRMSVSLRTF
jgi:hypothetical protein